MGGGEGQFGTRHRELAAAIEAKPTEPEQASPQKNLGHVVGRTHRLRPAATGTQQGCEHQSCDTRADVHHRATGKVKVLTQQTTAPDHVSQRRINQQQPDRGKQAPKAEADALHQST